MSEVPLEGVLREYLDEHAAAVFREPAVAANVLSDIVGTLANLDAAQQRALVGAVRDRSVARFIAPSPELGGVWNEPRRDDPLRAWVVETWAAPCDRPPLDPAVVGESAFGALTLELCARLGLRLERPMPTQRPIEAYLARAADGARVRIAGAKVGDQPSPGPAEAGDRTTVIEMGRSRAYAYTVSHAASGETLADRLAEHGPASVWVSQAVMRNLCLAVADLHRHGLVHGSLGPDNVLFDGLEHVVLADTGLLAVAGQPAVADADVQALAELAFHVFTGHGAPRRAGGAAPVPLRELAPDAPVEFALIVDRVMARHPGQVRPTARDLSRALGADLVPSDPPRSVPLPSAASVPPPPVAPPAAAASAPVTAPIPAPPTVQAAVAIPTPSSPPTSVPPGAGDAAGAGGSGGRRRMWLVVAAVAIVVAVVGAVLATRGGADPIVTDAAEVVGGVATFEVLEVTSDVDALRRWEVSDTELTGTTVLTNDADDPVTVVYDEVLPSEIAASADGVEFEPAPIEISLSEPFARYMVTVEAGGELEIAYTAALEDRPSDEDLAAWTEDWSDAYAAHLDDPRSSPRDGDEDGVPDLDDVCVDEPGPLAAGGCADVDGDTIGDATDLCPDASGPTATEGCPDSDGDTVADSTDRCVDVAGAAATSGCLDTDGDTVIDPDDSCVDVAGTAATLGCPDGDGDTVVDDQDSCPTSAGSTGAAGCPDGDGDGVADQSDRCPGEGGGAALAGCPDNDGDAVANPDDLCPDEAGTAAASGCPDGDGDGVADLFDQCPAAGGTSADGCPDSDGDGVDDGDDRCPAEAGTAEGCPDQDRDGVPDQNDRCDDVSGPRSNDGCPAPTTTAPPPTQPTSAPSNRSISLSGPSTVSAGVLSDRYSVSANGFTPVSISWSNGSTGSTARYTFTTPGAASVRVTVTDENGQSYSRSMSVTVT